MSLNQFVWTDLSTFDLAHARHDYARLFGWRFQGKEDYDFAETDQSLAAAIFPMPKRLMEIKMPSFWMSYVRVNDIEGAVAKARKHDGTIIEIEPMPFNDNARIALVRDPSGAGFTLYEGPDITPAGFGHGHVVQRYHHLPDLTLIKAFYEDLFGWQFDQLKTTPWPAFAIKDQTGELVAYVEEVPEKFRGKFRYWMPCFEVKSTSETLNKLTEMGGELHHDLGGGRFLVADAQGAHFMISSTSKPQEISADSANGAGSAGGRPWRAAVGLACMWLAVFFDLQAFWGLMFLLWTWPAIKLAKVTLIDTVSRSNQPLLYWAILGTWILLSLWLIVSDPYLWPSPNG